MGRGCRAIKIIHKNAALCIYLSDVTNNEIRDFVSRPARLSSARQMWAATNKMINTDAG